MLSDQEQVALISLMVSGKTCICISLFFTEVSSFACYPSTESSAVLSFKVCYISLISLSNSNGQLSLWEVPWRSNQSKGWDLLLCQPVTKWFDAQGSSLDFMIHYPIQSWSLCDSKTSRYRLCQGPLMDWVRGFETSLLPVLNHSCFRKGLFVLLRLLVSSLCLDTSLSVWEPNTSVQTFLKHVEVSLHHLWCLVCLYISIALALLNGCWKLPYCVFFVESSF